MSTTPTLYGSILCILLLAISTYTDIKTRMINPWLAVIVLGLSLIEGKSGELIYYLAGAMCAFAPIFITARFGSGGDGDALIAGVIGFIMPLPFTASWLIFTHLFYIITLGIAVIKTKDKKKQLPFIPFMAAAWIIVYIGTII